MKTKTGSSIKELQILKIRSNKPVLNLYIAGHTKRALTAMANLRSICDHQLKNKYSVKVIDLLKYPKLGRANQILAIPTLMKKSRQSVKFLIGDLSNPVLVLNWLNIS